MLVIDPPEGWKYNFPKPIPLTIKTSDELKEWLLYQGYPAFMLDTAVKYSRYWECKDA